MSIRRRVISTAGAMVVAGGLSAAGVIAFACTAASAIGLTGTGSALPGAVVSGTGHSFAPGGTVHLYFNATSGAPIWTSGVVPAQGTIAFQFTVPNVPQGYYFVATTETGSNNVVMPGAARAPITVNAVYVPPTAPAAPGAAKPPATVPVGHQPAPGRAPTVAVPVAVAPPAVAAPRPAPVAPVASVVAPPVASDQLQPSRQHEAGDSQQGAHSASHPLTALALGLVIGGLVFAVAVGAFLASRRSERAGAARARR